MKIIKRLICGIIAALLVLMMISPAYAAIEGWPMPPTCPEGTHPTPAIDSPKLTVTNNHSTGKPYLKWNKVKGAVVYDVYKMSEDSCDFVLMYTTKGDHLTHGSAKTGEKHRYIVQAIDKNGYGYNSNVAVRTCDLPRPNMELAGGKQCPPWLTWDKVPGATSYELWASCDGGTYKRIYKTKNGTRCLHKSVKLNHLWRYKVRAMGVTNASNSAFSYTRSVYAEVKN